MSNGLTGCTEYVKGFLGRKPVLKKNTKNGVSAYFDISFGVNAPDTGKFGTWRHCIAYNQNAELLKDCKPGTYLLISGWVTTNPVYNEQGIQQFADGKPVTKEFLIVDKVTIQKRDNRASVKQLNLVESGG